MTTERTVVLAVAAAVLVAAVALIVVVAGGRHAKSSTAPAHGPTPTAVTTTPPSSASTTSSAPASTASTGVVGLVVNGAGSTLTAPSAPTVVPFTSDCHALVDPGSYGQCLTVVAPSGTIAAIVEQQQQSYQRGQPITANQERDLVYRRQGDRYRLALRRAPAANGSAETRLYQSDVNRDGDPKAVFVTPAPNSRFANELDVVEGSGAVTLHRQLHGGFAGIAAEGGLDTFVPDPSQGYDEAVIRYRSGGWQIISERHVSDAQAQSQNAQPFNDPKGSTPG